MHLYARCSERHLISVSSVQYTVSGVYICVVMLDKDGLYHCNADSFTQQSERRFFFFFQGDANLLCLLLSFTDEFTAVPRCSKHSLAGSLGPLCGSSTQDQRQPGSAPPGECRPVWQTAHVTGQDAHIAGEGCVWSCVLVTDVRALFAQSLFSPSLTCSQSFHHLLSHAATALKMNMNLRELYLADNKLNGLQDSAQLGNLLKFNYNIQILDLRNNHILDSGTHQ